MQHLIEQYSQTPNVNFLIMIFLEHNFRSHVLTSSTETFSHLIFLKVLSPAKVTQLDIEVLIKKNILWLEIPVHDALRMKIVNGFANLVEKSHGQFLRHSFLRVYIEVEIAFQSSLKHNINIAIIIEGLNKLNQVKMLESLMNSYLVIDVNKILLVETFSINFFDGNNLIGFLAPCLDNPAKCSFPKYVV